MFNLDNKFPGADHITANQICLPLYPSLLKNEVYYIIKSLIFAQKTLAEDEFTLYTRFFNIIFQQLPRPDLLVYLHMEISKLQENIKIRGRTYEKKIENKYLEKIQEGYFDFIKQQSKFPILVIDINNCDFVQNPDDYRKIVSEINKEYMPGVHRILL